MKAFSFSFFFIFIFSPSAIAQPNLVQNPSFEAVTSDLENWTHDRAEFNNHIIGWRSPTEGSPDIFTNGITNTWAFNIHGLGFDRAHTGRHMVGITTFVPPKSRKHHKREYLSVSLTEPLKVGKKYKVACWVKNPERAIRSSHLGFLLTADSFYLNTDLRVNACPQLEIDSVLDAGQWTHISLDFVATEEANYLTIGNFETADSVDYYWWVKRPIDFAYYYIDDVSVMEMLETDTLFTVGKVFTLSDIFFEKDKTTLLLSATTELQRLAKYLKASPNLTLCISGHTDETGDERYNQRLSEGRAKAVAEYLAAQGIEKKRLKYQGFGESLPIADNETEAGKQQNRRVEFVLSH